MEKTTSQTPRPSMQTRTLSHCANFHSRKDHWITFPEMPEMLNRLFRKERTRHASMVQGQVTSDSARCVQCGICSFNCPVDIDVRRHAWLGEPVIHSRCLTCGECVARCPRGVLKFERTNLFTTSVE